MAWRLFSHIVVDLPRGLKSSSWSRTWCHIQPNISVLRCLRKGVLVVPRDRDVVEERGAFSPGVIRNWELARNGLSSTRVTSSATSGGICSSLFPRPAVVLLWDTDLFAQKTSCSTVNFPANTFTSAEYSQSRGSKALRSRRLQIREAFQPRGGRVAAF